MAKTGYLKDQTNGGSQSPPRGHRFASDNVRPLERSSFRTAELSHFRTLEPPCAGFSVIELTMVIGVLALLLAIVLPTIKTVRASALRNRAQAEATALAQAAIHYKSEYGFWPGQLQAKDDDTVELRAEFKNLTGFIPVIISGTNTFTDNIQTTGGTPVALTKNEVCQAFRRTGRKEGELFKPNPLNPKGILFLDLVNEEDPLTVSFPDPWGQGYILFMGLNPASSFTHTVTTQGGGAHSFRVDNTIAFAFSLGPDGMNSTNYLYSAGVK